MARIELDRPETARAGIDANWSERRRRWTIVVACAVSVLALVGGVWIYLATRPLGLPTSAQQAIDTIRSPRFKDLDPGRKGQILAEAGRLFAGLSPEARKSLQVDDAASKALKDASFNDYVRRLARGEKPAKKPGNKAEKPKDKEAPADAEAQAAATQAWVRGMRNDRQRGNAQDAGLQGEFWSQFNRGAK